MRAIDKNKVCAYLIMRFLYNVKIEICFKRMINEMLKRWGSEDIIKDEGKSILMISRQRQDAISQHQVSTKSTLSPHQVDTKSVLSQHQVDTKSALSQQQIDILEHCAS